MIKIIPLNELAASNANVRRSGNAQADAELKADIEARGLLQNLVVPSLAKSHVCIAVEAGERRRRALQALADGKLAPDHELCCLVIDRSSATEASLYKIILFGSYARDDWVDEPENGYQSDFDLLIVVSHKDLTEIADYWYIAEDRILRDAMIGRPVNIIVHSLDEVNQALTRGEYFWVDIARDGIALYELPGHALATPMPATPHDALKMANAYFSDWMAKIDDAIEIATFCISRQKSKDAAFNLHQAAERAYTCFLLVQTLYVPRSHNIKFLRSLAEDSAPRLIAAWPRENKIDRRRFELLKRAYVEARYSNHYHVTRLDLDALLASVRRLRDLVEQVSRGRVDKLSSDTGTRD